MAEFGGRNKNYFALLQDLSDSDTEAPKEVVKAPAKASKPVESAEAKPQPVKAVQPKTQAPKTTQPKQNKSKQASQSTKPLNPLPNLPTDPKPSRPADSRKQDRPKQEGLEPTEERANTHHDKKRRPAEGDDRKDRSTKGGRVFKKDNSKYNLSKPVAEEPVEAEEVKAEEGKTEEVPADTQTSEVKEPEKPAEPEVVNITLAEFYGKQLQWNRETQKPTYNFGMKSQHSDLLSFQVKSEPERQYERKDRKPNRAPRKDRADIQTSDRPRRNEPRQKKPEKVE